MSALGCRSLSAAVDITRKGVSSSITLGRGGIGVCPEFCSFGMQT